jgi:hypothetical protein
MDGSLGNDFDVWDFVCRFTTSPLKICCIVAHLTVQMSLWLPLERKPVVRLGLAHLKQNWWPLKPFRPLWQ